MKHLQVGNENPDEEMSGKKNLSRSHAHSTGRGCQGRGGCGRDITRWDLADGGRVPTIALVTVGGLHEDSAVAEALCEDLPSDVVQPHASP